MFKVVSKNLTESNVINERAFDECCQEKGYEPKDRSKLIQILNARSS